MLVFIVLASESAQAKDTLETAVNMDGARRIGGSLIYRSKEISAGLSYRWDPADTDDVMAGLNMSWISLGHLDDAGLFSEVRNPGPEALGRLGERSFHKADIRSLSQSRMGLALSGADGHASAALERRGENLFGTLWIEPLFHGAWSGELLCVAAELDDEAASDGWYFDDIDDAGRGAGSAVFPAAKLRLRMIGWEAGTTVMGSWGTAFNPGWGLSLACGYSGGPWRFRSRGTLFSEFFRNSDGERLDLIWGLAGDLRYKPKKGFRGEIDYIIEQKRSVSGFGTVSDSGEIALGYSFLFLEIGVSGDLNTVFSAPSNTDSTFVISSLHSFLRWYGQLGTLYLSTGYFWNEELRFKSTYDSPRWDLWSFSIDLVVEGIHTDWAADLGLGLRLDFGKARFFIDVDFRGLPDQWEVVPTDVVDAMELSIRYIQVLFD